MKQRTRDLLASASKDQVVLDRKEPKMMLVGAAGDIVLAAGQKDDYGADLLIARAIATLINYMKYSE